MQSILEQFPDRDVDVFVVWEPVLFSDIGSPTNSVLAKVKDTRVRQLWDRNRQVAEALRPMLKSVQVTGSEALVQGSIIWDTVVVFPPSARWNAKTLPIFVGAPVADSEHELRKIAVSQWPVASGEHPAR